MILFAHPGHWAVQLIYLFPLVVLVGVIMAGRIRDRREERAELDAAAGESDQLPDEPEKAP